MSPVSGMSHSLNISGNPRVLILSGLQKQVLQQLNIFNPVQSEVYDRDIMTLIYDGHNFKIVENLTAPQFVSSSLREYEVFKPQLNEEEFSLLLIGKDGGLKQKWVTPVSFNDIANIIDQMPMRQREML